MQYRVLGSSSIPVSVMGLGCNTLGVIDDGVSAALVARALDSGITHFDTAASYAGGRSEETLGRALGSKRQHVVIATKVANPHALPGGGQPASRNRILEAVDQCLRRLRTDWIDVLYLHFPDPATPVEETMSAFQQLLSHGKIRAYALSNHSATQVMDCLRAASAMAMPAPACAQGEYHLLKRDAETALLPLLASVNVGFVPSFPLAGGLLTGKYQRGQRVSPDSLRARIVRQFNERFLDQADWNRIERLTAFATATGRTLTELALAWLIADLRISSVICGASKPEQLQSNMQALALPLSATELARLAAIGEQILSG